MSEPPEPIRCASYTHARRHPMVLGRIAGWAPPFQLSVVQIVVLLVMFVGLTWTWSAWAPLLPDSVSLVAAVGVPAAAAWAVRRVRVEGRSLPRAAAGWVTLWCAPRSGRVAGRPHRQQRRACTNTAPLYMARAER